MSTSIDAQPSLRTTSSASARDAWPRLIEEIRIHDLGVITDAVLPLGPGLSILSGETGAGKTMVVTALGMLLGNRSDAGAVRSGAPKAVAEAVRAERSRDQTAPTRQPERVQTTAEIPAAAPPRPATAAEASVIGKLQSSVFRPMLFGVRRR